MFKAECTNIFHTFLGAETVHMAFQVIHLLHVMNTTARTKNATNMLINHSL